MRSSTDTTREPEDLGDAKTVAERAKRVKNLEQRRLDGLKQTMSTANGRAWMWGFLETCGLFSTEFNGNSRDYFRLGMRNAAMPIFLDLQNHCLDEYMTMAKEAANV